MIITSFGRIDLPDVIGNTIREEMSAVTGTNWRQRSSYTRLPVNGVIYTPYSAAASKALMQAKRLEGTMRGYISAPPPVKEVIAEYPK
ncbi:hypothetical protein [Chitinophaga nivalis]|uniref:Uncharacterized protein n=1 Tax=Chitinophaga nivalis TaxID=2991709 RepID=A0ABT3IT50_9BACT|nr:hypothetical protein [Chitinophaga nivalis]MCW3463159.1 hypothetical protein [Chitinophaga nivalis]MCW3487151.1 hypothetical protein [Chitinophaga nivalis]